MTIERVIEMHMRSLTSEWYQTQRKRFESEQGFDKECDCIKRQVNIGHWGVSEDGSEHYSGSEIVEDHISFEKYAWFDSDRDLYEPLPEDDYKAHRDPIDASFVATRIINSIGDMLPSGDITTSYKALKESQTYIEENIQSLRRKTSIDPKFLDFFEAELISDLWVTHSRVSELYRFSSAPEKVDFILNQDQLAALLYLITESGFIDKVDKTGKTQFYNFCQKHFYCQKKGSDAPAPISNLAKKISDVKTGESLQPLEQIFKDLQKTYKNTFS